MNREGRTTLAQDESTIVWQRIASVAEVQLDGTLARTVGSRAICLYDVDGEIFATDDVCTHGNASLAAGFIDGDCIECPLHQGRFHIPSGKAVSAPCVKDIGTYAVKVVDGEVLLDSTDLG
jgi:nitrite reductase/ring-hydroxylating ferredoxin subunit